MNKIVIIDGLRTPFLRSWTGFKDTSLLSLSKTVVEALISKINLDKNSVTDIIFGSVFPPVYSPNIAREIILNSDLPKNISGFTLNRACASGAQAVTSAFDMIYRDSEKTVISGGCDSISQMDFPINDEIKNFLYDISKLDNLKDYKELALKIIPKIPKLAEISTGLSMGEYADIMAKENNITREEQDRFSLNSHKKAFEAMENGYIEDEITEVNGIINDNNVRSDSSLETLSRLKPVFSKNGTVTAGNSSTLTDGAAALILTSESNARKMCYAPKAIIQDYVYTAIDTRGQMLMGNAYSIPLLLKRNNLKLSEIDFFEMHEAFASQVLSNIKAINSEEFTKKELKSEIIGHIPDNKLNIYGGSVSIGHPFGATGIRLINTMSNILKNHNKQYGVVSLCAAGGMSVSILIKGY